MICDVRIKDGGLHSEDIHMFSVLLDGGFKVYLDPEITCNHTGPYKFVGDFNKWLSKSVKKRQL